MPITAEEVIPRMFLPQLRALHDAIFVRVLQAFDGLETEAAHVQQEAYERLAEYADEYTDGANLAESAFEAGLEHFDLMAGTLQTVINAFAAALSHLFEQQRHLLSLCTLVDSEPDSKKSEDQFLALLEASGVDWTAFTNHAKLRELRYVGNVVKHAEGPSAKRLRALRPDLFVHPSIRGESSLGLSSIGPVPPVTLPLMGEDLFVQPDDLRAYLEAVETFWQFVLDQLSSEP